MRKGKRGGRGKLNLKTLLALIVIFVVVTKVKMYMEPESQVQNRTENTKANKGGNHGNRATRDGSVARKGPALDLVSMVKDGNVESQIIVHEGFVTCVDYKYNTPRWVAWELDSDELNGDVKRKDYEFMPDEELPIANRVETRDYTRSGYDRGHMCPAADMSWSTQAMHDCFYMSNICPQVPVLNQEYWARLENSCRRWAKREGRIYIVCGPVYTSSRPKKIGDKHKVAVPNAFFKVVLSLNEDNPKGIGFYYENKEKKQTMESASRTIDEIENLTNLDFFSELPDDVENVLEAQNDLRKWD